MKQKARLTVDMSIEEHTCLKMASAELNLTMREFLLRAAFEKIETCPDPWLSEQAIEALKKLSEPRKAR